jgi:hypothetical protein
MEDVWDFLAGELRKRNVQVRKEDIQTIDDFVRALCKKK